MELVLVVVIVALLALLVRQHLSARAAGEEAGATLAALRAEAATAEERARGAERALDAAADRASAAATARAEAEAESRRRVADADRRAAEADDARRAAEAAAAAAGTERERAAEESAAAVAAAEARVAALEDDLARADKRVATAEEVASQAEDRAVAAERQRRSAEERARGARSGAADAEAVLTEVLSGGVDTALAHALLDMELSRIDRAWRATIAPMAADGAVDGGSSGALITTAIAHELERAREEVGIATEMAGRLDADLEPLVALVALRAVQELVAETIRCCNSVEVTFGDGASDGAAVTVSGEGGGDAAPDVARVGKLVAVVAGSVTSSTTDDGSVATEVRVPSAVPVVPDDA